METATATPSPTPTAPATSGAPAATPSRPTSFASAFTQNPVDAPASPASSPARDPSSADQPPAATAPAVETPPAVTPAPGPIPYERHKSILDNAYKERDEFRTKYSALEAQIASPDGQRLRQWATAYQQNPEQWFANTVAELAANNPNLVPALRSQAARLLGQRQAPQTDPSSFEPDIPVYDETGKQVTQTFSADRVKAIVQHAVNEALQREVSPMKQDFQQRKQQEQAAAVHREANQVALAQYNEMKDEPGFLVKDASGKDVVDPDLAKTFNEHPEWSLETCYRKVVVPKLRAKQESQVLDDLKTKAAASTSVNPSAAVVASTRKPTSLLDKSLQW